MAADTGFSIPDLATLVQRAEAAINAYLPGADARLRRNVLSVLARVQAGQTHGLYGFQNFIATTALPDRAPAEYLEAWSKIWGVLRKPASLATGSVEFSGTPGAVIPAGTLVQRSDGVRYQVTEGGEIGEGGSVTVPVEALEAGSEANAAEAVAVSLINPMSGVQTDAEVAAGGIAGGAEAESDDDLRERLMARIQTPPHGGALADYHKWALEVPGVTRAWVTPQELGPGTVTIRFAMDRTHENGIPGEADVEAVQAYIDERRPVTAEVFVVAPEAAPLDVEIADLSPSTPSVKAAVEAELADMIKRDGVPGGTIYLSRLWEAVATAAGERSHRITSPTDDVTFATNELPVLGTVTYV